MTLQNRECRCECTDTKIGDEKSRRYTIVLQLGGGRRTRKSLHRVCIVNNTSYVIYYKKRTYTGGGRLLLRENINVKRRRLSRVCTGLARSDCRFGLSSFDFNCLLINLYIT